MQVFKLQLLLAAENLRCSVPCESPSLLATAIREETVVSLSPPLSSISCTTRGQFGFVSLLQAMTISRQKQMPVFCVFCLPLLLCLRFQASSSEMFGSSSVELQNEETPFKPCSPYGNMIAPERPPGLFCLASSVLLSCSAARSTRWERGYAASRVLLLLLLLLMLMMHRCVQAVWTLHGADVSLSI